MLQPDKPQRLLSLDAFRGITIAGMILVNNPGSWGRMYSPLGHAKWNGLTPTDLVFPFFLFIVGVAITFAFARRLEVGVPRAALMGQVARRSAILILLGLSMFGFPDWRLIAPFVLVIAGLALQGDRAPAVDTLNNAVRQSRTLLLRAGLPWLLIFGGVAWFVLDFQYFDASKLRVPGVLQRIGLCYLFASLIVLTCDLTARAVWVVVLLGVYWAIVRFVSAPAEYAAVATGLEAPPDGLLHDWIDVKLLGAHLYGKRPDPEGLLSTIPAIATVLCGVLVGDWLRAKSEAAEKVVWLFLAGAAVIVAGLWMGLVFPLNKKIWTSSYVLVTAGIAMQGLATCYWLIDVKGVRRWAWPFVMFGSNAIVLFVGSSLTAKMLGRWKVPGPDGKDVSASGWVYRHVFVPWAGELNGSLLYAITYVLLWLVPAVVLYRRRIFVKV